MGWDCTPHVSTTRWHWQVVSCRRAVQIAYQRQLGRSSRLYLALLNGQADAAAATHNAQAGVLHSVTYACM